jgi:hypothetical protein
MFILRTIREKYIPTAEGCNPHNTQVNAVLGKSYTFIDSNNPDFEDLASSKFKEIPGELWGFILDECSLTHSLWTNDENYIMTETGKTFSRLPITK